jgi:stearoyl-CoA desaturase (delta-9 desaturase)
MTKSAIDLETVQAVIANRYDVLAKYAKSLKATYADELKRLAPHDAEVLRRLKRWLTHDESRLEDAQRTRIADGLARSKSLSTVYVMRRELVALWERSHASRDQLVKQLQDWCQRAEATGIRPLVDFSRRLRCYA